jgi:hypothetical protein
MPNETVSLEVVNHRLFDRWNHDTKSVNQDHAETGTANETGAGARSGAAGTPGKTAGATSAGKGAGDAAASEKSAGAGSTAGKGTGATAAAAAGSGSGSRSGTGAGCRAQSTSRQGQAPTVATPDAYDKELQDLLDGIDDNWDAPFPRHKFGHYDIRHWMAIFSSMLGVKKGEPLYNLFMELVSDAIFTILPGEYHRVRHFLQKERKNPLTDAQVKQKSRRYWRRMCRFSVEEPKMIIPRLFSVYKFFAGMTDPLRSHENRSKPAMVLVDDHWDIFQKMIKYVQEGSLSDIPGMEMYRLVKRVPGQLDVYRCLRTTSALEAHFAHFHKSVKTGAKGMGKETLHIRTNLYDWGWNVDAAQTASVIPRVGHSWLWLVDKLADVCSDLDASTLPATLKHWKRVDTSKKPCTFRGVDWELDTLRNESKRQGVDVSPLHSRKDISAVLQYPDLVLKRDWVTLEEKTGIQTNTKALESLIDRSLKMGLSFPHAEAHGLQQLRASLRTLAISAPTSAVVQQVTDFQPGNASHLPLAHIGSTHGKLNNVYLPSTSSHQTVQVCMRDPSHPSVFVCLADSRDQCAILTVGAAAMCYSSRGGGSNSML